MPAAPYRTYAGMGRYASRPTRAGLVSREGALLQSYSHELLPGRHTRASTSWASGATPSSNKNFDLYHVSQMWTASSGICIDMIEVSRMACITKCHYESNSDTMRPLLFKFSGLYEDATLYRHDWTPQPRVKRNVYNARLGITS